MNVSVSKKNIFFILVSLCVLTSPGLSYSILYPYHLILPIVVFFIFYKFSKNGFLANKFTFYLSIFYLYCCFSTIYLANKELFLNYLIYIFISFSCMVYIYDFMGTSRGIEKVVKLFSIYLIVILLIGFLESLNIIRLPFSPYSPYSSIFGKSLDISEWSDDVFLYNIQKPTVFSGNPNTYGFILVCFLPFLFLIKSRIIQFVLLIFSLFIIYKIDSKMILLVVGLFLILKYLTFARKNIIFFMIAIFSIFFLYPIVIFLQNLGVLEGRMFTAVDELIKGVDFIFGNSSGNQMDSTGERAYIYSIGIDKFKETYGIGMGWSGIESYLLSFFGKHTAFHNFFLMILVDLGVLGFVAVFLFYLFLIKNLYIGFIKYKDTQLEGVFEAFLFGVVLSVIASITPSGIIYLLPYWFFIGAASFMAFNYKKIGRTI